MIKALSIFIFLFCFSTQTALANPPKLDKSVLSAEVYAKNVHLSYLDGNFKQMTLLIKDALLAHPYDETLKTNLLNVLEKAYTHANSSDIQPDWHLPPQISSLNVGVFRHTFENDLYWGYDVNASLHIKQNSIKDFTLKNVFGKIILQKSTELGKWSEGDKSHGEWVGKIQNHVSKSSLPSGIYFISVLFQDPQVQPFEAWFILPNALLNTFPTVTFPSNDMVIQNQSPKFSWNRFDPPIKNAFKQSSISVFITAQDCETHDPVFYFSTTAPVSEVQIDNFPSDYRVFDYSSIKMSHNDFKNLFNQPTNIFVSGVKQLKNGKHLFSIDYSLDRYFGDMGFGLATQNTIGFRVETNDASNTYDCNAISNDYAKK